MSAARLRAMTKLLRPTAVLFADLATAGAAHAGTAHDPEGARGPLLAVIALAAGLDG